MNKYLIIDLFIVLSIFVFQACSDNNQDVCQCNNIILYEDASNISNYKFHPGGWMGAINSISYSDICTENPYQGETCIKISYNTNNNTGWAGIYWLANDSWYGPGINMYSQYNICDSCNYKVTFWCRGSEGGESCKFKIGGVSDGGDSINPAIETDWLVFTTSWTKYEIDISNKDLFNLVGGFCWVTNNESNTSKENVIIYIDNIIYEAL